MNLPNPRWANNRDVEVLQTSSARCPDYPNLTLSFPALKFNDEKVLKVM
jgi:hypothetical protein